MPQFVWLIGLALLIAKLWNHIQYGERRGWI